MIKEDEITQVAKVFGSTVETIRKDHAISHVLHCLSKIVNKPEEKIVVFYGGTALNRTYFKDFRLSEDIDLIVESYPQWIETMKAELLTLISYEYNDAMWTSERERTQDGVWTGFLACTQGVEVQIQCVKPRARWDYYLPHLSAAPVELRYSDLPTSVEFLVPNVEAFAAMKICAWLDRQAPRDLADLSELSKKGYITNTALDLAKNVCGIRLSSGVLGQSVPTRVTREWEQELSHQGSSTGTPKECFDQLFQVLQEIENR